MVVCQLNSQCETFEFPIGMHCNGCITIEMTGFILFHYDFSKYAKTLCKIREM